MLPVLKGLIQRFVDGPNATYLNFDGTTFVSNTSIVGFTNDGQINQLAAEIGIFDNEAQLPATYVSPNRLFRTSNFVTMRGTISFETLNCASEKFIRVRLNDAVYPVVSCQSGPGRSCPLQQYLQLIEHKLQNAGDFQTICNITSGIIPVGQEKTTFWTDVTLPYEILHKP